jgi:hypothetical protein
MGRSGNLLFPTRGNPSRSELLAVTTLVDEVALKRSNLLVEEEVRLVEQTNDRVGDYA